MTDTTAVMVVCCDCREEIVDEPVVILSEKGMAPRRFHYGCLVGLLSGNYVKMENVNDA